MGREGAPLAAATISLAVSHHGAVWNSFYLFGFILIVVKYKQAKLS